MATLHLNLAKDFSPCLKPASGYSLWQLARGGQLIRCEREKFPTRLRESPHHNKISGDLPYQKTSTPYNPLFCNRHQTCTLTVVSESVNPGERSMRSPHGLEMIESCASCRLRANGMFCHLSPDVLKAFEDLRYTATFPKGAVLFVEGQSPRGVFMLCAGRVKLSTGSSEGKTLITHVAEAGEMIGLCAAISGRPFEVTAETLAPCQINFIKREDFLSFLKQHGEACLRVAEHLSDYYHAAFEQSRSLGLSSSAAGKLAGLILEWCDKKGKPSERGTDIKLLLTHEEIAQMIGASRETVTRLFSDFKARQVVYVKGATLLVRDKAALEAIALL